MQTKFSKIDLIVNSRVVEIAMKRTAAHFGYGEIESEDEMKNSSEMVFEMAKLPKYDDIKSAIKNSSGIVNFVTNNEYTPLVEFILKSALPPTNNDVFNRGFAATLPTDYFIDAKHFMNAANAQLTGRDLTPEQARQLSMQELETVIRGSRKKMTKEWVRKQGWDIDDIDDYFTDLPPETSIKDTIDRYEKAINLLKKDPIVGTINKLWSELQNDYNARFEMKSLEGKNDAKSKARMEELKKFILSGEVRKEKSKQLMNNRNVYRRKEMAIQNHPDFRLINISDDFSGGVPEYEDNGFMRWNPIEKIKKAFFDGVITLEDEMPDAREEEKNTEAKRRIANFIQLVTEYKTSDRDLMEIRNKILDILGKDENKYVINYDNNYLRIVQLMNSFVGKGKDHGKVLIFNNVENSGLVSREVDEGRERLTLRDPTGVFSDFADLNDENEARDVQDKMNARGKRTIVFISSSPMQGLPKGATIVEMKSSPVDEAEARIIVKYLLEPYVNQATRAAETKRYHDIAEKYMKQPDEIKEMKENEAVPIEIEKMKDTLAYISPEGRESLEQLISGMGQKEAIATIRGSLSSNAKFVKDQDGILSTITFDEQSLLKKMMEDSNKRKTEGRLGLVCRRSKVRYDQYITKKASAWGKIVGNLGITIRDADSKNQEIVSVRKKITNLESELMNPKLSTQTRSEKLKLRDDLEKDLERLYTLKNGYLREIPHFTVLWGKPGTGKCLKIGTPIIMFDGSSKNVEDIVVGDLLMGPDSKPRTVLSLTRGIGPLYKVSQKLGDDYVCNNAHILSLQNTDKPSNQEPIFISAEDFCKKNKTWKFRNKGWKSGVEFQEKKILIDPYWIGLWLGDGHSNHAGITVAKKDVEIENWLEEWAIKNNMRIRKEKSSGSDACLQWHFVDLDNDITNKNHISKELRDLGILNNKHIPNSYLRNNSSIRLSLLAGLIDSDGYMDKRTGSISFTNVNRQLAEDVLWLARSLGFRAFWGESIKTIKSIDYKVLAYTVTIGGSLSRIPTKLPRKQGHDNPQKKSLRYGIDVKPIGEGEYFGFTIDGDQQFLLGDFTVTHNSVWADALADVGKFMIYNVEIGQVKSKWVGETSKFTRQMLDTIFSSRNAVFLLDEIDRMMEMGEGSQGTGSSGPKGHETTKDIVAQFLARFEDDRSVLIDRNIFVIMTTNNLAAVDTALLSRTRGNVKEVEASDDPADYVRFLQTFLETEKRDVPNDPWIKDVGTTNEEQWAYTFDFFKNKINLQAIAQEFARKEIGFRDLSGIMKDMCRNHNIWRVGKAAIERGETTEVHGIPMTTENIVKAARLTVDTSSGNAQAVNGVDQVVMETSLRVEKLLKEGNLVETIDPATGKKTFKIDEKALEALEGKGEEEEENQFTVEPREDGKSKRLQKAPKPGTTEQKSIKDLDSSGFSDVTAPPEQETPAGEVPQKTAPPKPVTPPKQKKKEKEEEDKKSTIEANTTDYLYNFLKKAKIIDEDGGLKVEKDRLERERIEKEEAEKALIRGNPVKKETEKQAKSYDAELESRGVYFCNDNQILIAPMDAQTPLQDSQRLKFNK